LGLQERLHLLVQLVMLLGAQLHLLLQLARLVELPPHLLLLNKPQPLPLLSKTALRLMPAPMSLMTSSTPMAAEAIWWDIAAPPSREVV
jgi:hypothetical protein